MATSINTAAPNSAAAYPSDEEILGLVPDATDDARSLNLPPERFVSPSLPHNTHRSVEDSPVHRDAVSGDAAVNRRVNPSQGESASQTPQWIEEIRAANPQASGQLAALWQRAAAVEDFDRAFYGDDGASRQQFVERLYADNPAALRAMFAAAEQILGRAPQLHEPPQRQELAQRADNRAGDAARGQQANQAQGAQQNTTFNPASYAEFERSTNDAVVSELNRVIESTLNRALPNDIADGARRRIASDTLGEIHTALRGDRQLSQRVAEVMRGGRLDDATRAAVAQLIAARARGLVSTAARRVVGEWTSSVLATHRERTSRQQATQSRVDITGGGLTQPAPRKAVRAGDIDYRSTTDEQILGW
jgi:hypothetical protein